MDLSTDFRDKFLELLKSGEPKEIDDFFEYVAEETESDIQVETDGYGNVFIDDDLFAFMDMIGFNYLWKHNYFEISRDVSIFKFDIVEVKRRISNFENVEEYISLRKVK